ncbi:MAG: hypothetical protein Q8K30_00895 [Candidatus Gracilibacteria bacterium]|nr:hypothetical protein [Candidatus Gracilibacteria bacterium]
MTTLTIKEDIKISKKDFNTYEDLVNFVLYDNSILELEKLSKEEVNFIDTLDSYNEFKNLANSIGK